MRQSPQRNVRALVVLSGAVAFSAVLVGCGGHNGSDTAAAGAPVIAQPAATVSAGLGGGSQMLGAPHTATMPTHATGSPPQASPTGSASSSPTTHPTVPAITHPAITQPAATQTGAPQPSGMASSPSSTSAASPSSGSNSGSANCTDPQYVTSDPTAMWNLSPYFVANDMWNISGYNVTQTLYACSYSDWYVVASMTGNPGGGGAVKTYPNSHRDFDSEPQINSFSSITSTFAETNPGTGTFEDAYDIWLNGVATPTCTEVMIWTDNHGQTPAGTAQTTVTIDGRSYTVYKTTGNYIAFVANTNFSSGTMNLMAFFQWIMAKGWIPSTSTLGQVDYGAELVSTNGVPATFTFSNFSVDAS